MGLLCKLIIAKKNELNNLNVMIFQIYCIGTIINC